MGTVGDKPRGPHGDTSPSTHLVPLGLCCVPEHPGFGFADKVAKGIHLQGTVQVCGGTGRDTPSEARGSGTREGKGDHSSVPPASPWAVCKSAHSLPGSGPGSLPLHGWCQGCFPG